MKIREADFSDVPAIVGFLKKSLGDELPISEEIWRYKHIENPFGESIVLLAEEEKQVVGVRALMRWKWQKGETTYSCLRAVDTASHPEFRGRGIFKKLTLKAVEIAENNRDYFVFNTPNDQSRPGYLKMGWQILGKIKVGVMPSWNSFWKFWECREEYLLSSETSPKELESLCAVWNQYLALGSGLFTPKNPEYLHWRYERNPLQKYEIYAGDDIYLAASIKKRKKIKELRIVECIFRDEERNLEEVRKKIKRWSIKFGVQFISFSPRFLKLRGPLISASIGPILTIRNLNVEAAERPQIYNIDKWSYSLGDLELF